MKLLYILILLTATIFSAKAQMNKNVSVPVNAKVNATAKTITLYWPKYKDATKVDLFQKNFTNGLWELKKTRTGADSGFFTINSVVVGTVYEFQVAKTGGTAAYGYIYAAINKEESHNEGNILLLIDSALNKKIPLSIKQYEIDLIGSGWKTEKVIVSPKTTVPEVKAIILSKTNLKSVVIIGHVAVPYSGYLGFDGHPDHQGAWPADMYYGSLTGDWTDTDVTANPSGARPETINVPGDGKFDQQGPSSPIDLEVARIDLTRLPAFGKSDSAIHAYYFQKNHFFRIGGFNHQYKAVVDDNFTSYEMTSWGFRSYAPAVDTGNLFYNKDNSNYDYDATLKNNWWMLAAASGPGSYTSCGGVITSNQFVSDSIKTVISGMSGSYFGDWDVSNNLLRSALASKPSILNSFWGGIPAWILHPLALGYTMGYCGRMTMNNYLTYRGNFNGGQRAIHIALMGDPTTNIYPVKSASNITITGTATAPKVNWSASPDVNIVGYNVYRAKSLYGDFVKANSSLITGTSFTDTKPRNGKTVYMVRAVKQITNPAGIHNQMSQGIFDSIATVNLSVLRTNNNEKLFIYPNPVNNTLHIELPAEDKTDCTIEIYSINGRLMYKKNSSDPMVTINTDNLAPGMYIVKVFNTHFIVTQKLIKE